MKALVFLLLLSLAGCSLAVGPFQGKVWPGASLEVTMPLGSICLGCREPGVSVPDPNSPR